MSRILVISPSSFICRAFLGQAPADAAITVADRFTWTEFDLGAFDVVINFAFDPRMRGEAYVPERDFDGHVAEACAGRPCHFVMLSSRRAYGPGTGAAYHEDDALRPADTYGRNKAESEARVRRALGDACSILRVSNVFGFEPGRHTFFGRALQTLRDEGRITLDVNPFVDRDFIAVEDCAALLWRVVAAKPRGVFNLGRGEALAIGRVALWLIEGFGRGDLVVISPEERDAFAMDLARLTEVCGPLAWRTGVRDQCLGIGRRLAEECGS